MFLSMLADFFLASQFKNNYKAPLNIIPKQDTFSFINSINSYLFDSNGEITLIAKDIQDSDPMGILLSKETGAEILYSSELNTCWKRLVVVKELVHLVIEKLEYSDLNNDAITGLLEAVTNHSDGVGFDGYDPSCPLGKAEGAARLLAELVLIPWFETSDIKSSEKSDKELAQTYKVPLQLIENIRVGRRDRLDELMLEAYEARTKDIKNK